MIFRRREKRSWGGWCRDLVAPKKGWRRGFRYIGKRVQRLPDTPHRIALGFACGALASFTPFFTMHALVAALLAYLCRANVIAGVFGTVVGNPLTIFPIAASSLGTGNWLLGRSSDTTANFDPTDLGALWSSLSNEPFVFFESIFTPYLIGGVFPGLLCAAACYIAIRPVVAEFQGRRRRLLRDRANTLKATRPGFARVERRFEQLSRANDLLFQAQFGRLTSRRGHGGVPAE